MTLSTVLEKTMKKCKVGSGTKTIILTPHIYDEGFLQAFTEAAVRLGAQAMRIVAPPAEKNGKIVSSGMANPYLIDLLKTAEIVFEVMPMPYGAVYGTLPGIMPLYSDEFSEILRSNVRWLNFEIGNPERNVPRLFPSDGLIKRTILVRNEWSAPGLSRLRPRPVHLSR